MVVKTGSIWASWKLTSGYTGQAAVMSVVHPGGGTAYAISYSVQQIINALEGGEKPAVAIYGHYPKLMSMNWRNVWVLQAGCCQDQTPFMRSDKKIQAHVGGVLVKLEQDPATGSIIGFTPQMWQYFNTGYYQNRWPMAARPTMPQRTIGHLEKPLVDEGWT
jgi:hypothetical protein